MFRLAAVNNLLNETTEISNQMQQFLTKLNRKHKETISH